MIKVAPSLLSADFLHLEADVQRMAAADADILHYDVMDGEFVPNLSFGPGIASQVAKCGMPLDIHLMIVKPHRYLEVFAASKPEYITIHLEASEDVARDLKAIRDLGVKAGLSISPDTPVDAIKPYLGMFDLLLIMSVYPGFGGQKFIRNSLEKIRNAKKLLDEIHEPVIIEVDGGINEITGRECADAGAELLVAGSAMFKAPDAAAFCDALKCGC